MLDFFVHGTPIPKGSKRALQHKTTKKVVMIEDSKRSRPWQQMVAGSAVAHCDKMLLGPVVASLIFWMPAPKTIPKEREGTPCVKPDIDKLARVVLDALSGIAWKDDAQVISLLCYKHYATEENPPGVKIQVMPVKADDTIAGVRG